VDAMAHLILARTREEAVAVIEKAEKGK
jgi:hypothetical protein